MLIVLRILIYSKRVESCISLRKPCKEPMKFALDQVEEEFEREMKTRMLSHGVLHALFIKEFIEKVENEDLNLFNNFLE